MSKFVSTLNKGFFMGFENGFGISVQFGPDNYCEKKQLTTTPPEPMKQKKWDSLSAEIAVFEGEGMVAVGNEDAVIGWLSTNDVAAIIFIVSTATSREGLKHKIKELKF